MELFQFGINKFDKHNIWLSEPAKSSMKSLSLTLQSTFYIISKFTISSHKTDVSYEAKKTALAWRSVYTDGFEHTEASTMYGYASYRVVYSPSNSV